MNDDSSINLYKMNGFGRWDHDVVVRLNIYMEGLMYRVETGMLEIDMLQHERWFSDNAIANMAFWAKQLVIGNVVWDAERNWRN